MPAAASGVGVCEFVSFLTIISNMSSLKVMRSVTFDSSGVLSIAEVPVPSLKDGEIMIEVMGAGVNRMDLIQVSGKYPPPPGDSSILGVEVSGTVTEMTELARKNTDLKEGDRVMALVGGGGYAEFCTAPYQVVMRVPSGVDMSMAAGLPEVFLTAYQAIAFNGRLEDGNAILIHAGASGVGLAAIQICKALYNDITVIATAGSEEKLKACRDYGADVAVNYKTSDFPAEVLAATNGKGADVIIDPVGAAYWEKHSKCVAIDGRVLHIGFLGGAIVNSVNLGLELKKRVTHNFSTLRSRSLEYKRDLITKFMDRARSSFELGVLKVPMDSVFSLEKAGEAHARMKENKNIGKIVLSL